MTSGEHVPSPTKFRLAATVREVDDQVVARVTFEDVVGDHRVMDIKPRMALDLAGELIAFVRQVGLQ